MKKRLLVLLAFGVSFSPAVYAADSMEAAFPRVGELQLSEMNPPAFKCAVQEKVLPGESAEAVQNANQGTHSGARF